MDCSNTPSPAKANTSRPLFSTLPRMKQSTEAFRPQSLASSFAKEDRPPRRPPSSNQGRPTAAAPSSFAARFAKENRPPPTASRTNQHQQHHKNSSAVAQSSFDMRRSFRGFKQTLRSQDFSFSDLHSSRTRQECSVSSSRTHQGSVASSRSRSAPHTR